MSCATTVKCGKLNLLPFLLSATAFINDITDLLHNEDSVLGLVCTTDCTYKPTSFSNRYYYDCEERLQLQLFCF